MAFVMRDCIQQLETEEAQSRLPLVLSLKKTELLQVAEHYTCVVSSSKTKSEIQRVVIEKLINEKILQEGERTDEEDSEQVDGEATETIALRKLEIDHVIKLKQLESQERIRMREIELRERELELEVMRNREMGSGRDRPFDVGKYIKISPPVFSEKNVEQYFDSFEKMAKQVQWPEDKWAIILQSVLTGRAQDVYTAMSVEDSENYYHVKDRILNAYEQVPESYRQKFRAELKDDRETFSEFARKKEQSFDRWCRACECQESFDKLREMLLLEEFLRRISPEIRTHITDRKVETLKEAAILADEYTLNHKGRSQSRPQSATSTQSVRHGQQNFRPFRQNHNEGSQRRLNNSFGFRQRPTCAHCKKMGHVMSDCWRLRQNQSRSRGEIDTQRPVAAASLPPDKGKFRATVPSLNVDREFRPFISEGSVSLSNNPSQVSKICILRDTGAAQSLMLRDELPFSQESYTGSSVLIRGVGGVEAIPLHRVHVDSELVTGLFVVGVCDSLPVDGVSMLLGNDLAGSLVTRDPVMLDIPKSNDDDPALQMEFPDVFSECVVTRAAAKREAEQGNQPNESADPVVPAVGDINLADSFLTHLNDKDKDAVMLAPDAIPKMTREQLIREQAKDEELSSLMDKAMSEAEIPKMPVCYYISSGVLMRKWRPPEAPANEDWRVRHQIVLPLECRQDVLQIAHESPTGGHRGVNKTCERVLQHFFWPGLRSCVSDFVKSCKTCQTVGKPNQTVPVAPLKPIPAFGEPFSHVQIDCVGPLPKTKKGNQYILTIMCTSTRFPEAIPLRNISAKKIIEALIKFFTLMGLPKTLQSDQGSNFMSRIFQQVMHELGIQQRNSSAYHPQSQGAIERFHQSMKYMLKTYCHDNGKDWDEGLPFVLFAARETVSDSLGFSPFELVFGHNVRGPLKCLKEKLLCQQPSSGLIDYVSCFRDRLYAARKLAKTHLESAQIQMKKWYDRKSRSRSFSPGDQVLLLSPVPGQPLQARFRGPYTVERRVGDVDYVIMTPDRRKTRRLCHINLLKAYHQRSGQSGQRGAPPAVTPAVASVSALDDDFAPNEGVNLKNSEVLKDLDNRLSHLSPSQREELKALIFEYPRLFSDVPGRTNVVQHDVDVGDAAPIRQHPYRAHPDKQNKWRRKSNLSLKMI